MKKLIIPSIVLIIICSIFIYKDATITIEKSEKKKSSVTQSNVHAIGYQNQKQVFDVKIDTVTNKSNPNILYSNHVYDGHIYNNNEQIVISKLEGFGARINTTIKSIFVTNNIQAIIHPTTSTQSIKVSATEFKFRHRQNESIFNKNVMLTNNTITITSPKITYKTTKDFIEFSNGLTLINQSSTTNATTATLDINTSILNATNGITSTYKKSAKQNESSQLKALLKEPTTITSDTVNINFKNNHQPIIHYIDSATLAQSDKKLSAKSILIDLSSNVYEAKKRTHNI